MSVEAGGLQEQVMMAIQVQGDLLVTEPKIVQATTLQEAVKKGNTETVTMFAAPRHPTRSADVLNGYYRSIDAILESYAYNAHKRDARHYGFGMLDIGQRGYIEQVGKGLITAVDVSEEIILNRLVALRLFPNVRLAYESSRSEALCVFFPKELRRSERDLKRFGNAAVSRV